MDPRPVPAFYACYLLRSTVRHASLYIGSTPNPKRRLAQHNGLVKGGAFRTSKKTLRPWEMVCLVTGFPSNIAALQFEWTWQNPHLTRRIQEDQRITLRETITKVSKSGKVTKRPARPRMSLKDRLANLHLLLQVPSFARWPLSVRFYSADVYETWLKYVNDKPLESDMEVKLDVHPCPETLGKVQPTADQSILELDVTYDRYKAHLEKSAFILADGENVACDICYSQIQTPGHMALTCYHRDCRSASHLGCLSKKFLADEGSRELIPKRGVCPRCKTKLQWSDLITELSLRIRGEKEVAHIMRRRRPRRAKDAMVSQTPTSSMNNELDNTSEDEYHEMTCVDDILDEPLRHEADEDGFYDIDDFDDNSSIASDMTSKSFRLQNQNNIKPGAKVSHELTLVIEDSEYDSADTLD